MQQAITNRFSSGRTSCTYDCTISVLKYNNTRWRLSWP
ncbi:hypothetical protein [Escherichia phage vB_EcoS_swi2]|uniref:Uncharacterized protein n=3 Tax=Caudoviricetes TaxID=2731619 RepID=A0A1W6DY11_9CAUD|nr:hypothetical protein KGB45_gp14 [Salmonella phage LPST10]YP_010053890.1 hypothetical protein KGB46_gp38 [Salmonella phage VB_StyS_BS5]YP_010054113.1 hypothetical protein KGB49_gp05 [Escherichia phage vB_EcoS_swi2]DAK90772.1 MAG TPA: hypothetical protein [Caudoviricetes sp.]ARK07746.1 hypothetical protein LPST10_00014 [Salmonella phage LPST10]QHB48554.1 hypothetical protein [Salmonella phage VB_StyS_BS5]QNR52428.1 hypothetical protein [Escherichia phage vB_EcoS_swi2]